MGMNTAASTTKRLNTNTLKNTQPENAKLKPEGAYMSHTTKVDTSTEGMNVTSITTNISQNAVTNSFLKSAPNVI